MTKTNEPQDPLTATQNESEGTSSHNTNDGWGEPAPANNDGWGQETPADEGWQQASSNDDGKDLWSDNLSSESVEEAFLALIQSNKPQEEAEISSKPAPLSETASKPEEFSTFGTAASSGAAVEDEAASFLSMNQSSLEEKTQSSADAQLNPFQPVAAEEGSLHERLAEEIFSDMSADDLPEVTATEGQSITDALSETIAESLAELQSGQAVAETAELANQVRQEIASSQPPAVPEFPAVNPVNAFQPNKLEQETSPQEFVPSVMPYAALEENMGSTNNNDVVTQQHTKPISFENQKTTPPQNLNTPQDPQFNREFPSAGTPAQLNPPNAIHLETQNEAERTNVDPEFQALVQWNNSGVEPSHQGPNDIPNFLSQKREEESKFSFKTVFISLGITAAVVSMFYMGFHFGRIKPTEDGIGKIVDATADLKKQENQAVYEKPSGGDDAEKMFNEDGQDNQVVRQVKVAPSKPKASISVFTVKNLSGTAGRTIPMNIRLEGNNLGLKTMLLFRGIPGEIALSKGLKREDLWSVPISDLNSLSLVVPDNYKGQFSFEVFAFKDKESSPERRLASVNIASQPGRADVGGGISFENRTSKRVIQEEEKTAALPNNSNSFGREERRERVRQTAPAEKPVRQRPARKKQPAPVVSPHVEKSMLQRGNELLKNGDISGARLVFEHIASLGSKHAAFALARTYDENFIDQLLSSGVVPEKELAVKWYKKAAALGHREAEDSLAKLGLR